MQPRNWDYFITGDMWSENLVKIFLFHQDVQTYVLLGKKNIHCINIAIKHQVAVA